MNALIIMLGLKFNERGFCYWPNFAKGISFVDYFETGEIINSEYYCNLSYQLKKKDS